MKRIALFIAFLLIIPFVVKAQCATPINSFPYNEGFESSDGGWGDGGTGSDWAWGTPSKTVINTAGSGMNCWITGGLTGNSYTNGEASWLQSPCFDFTNLTYPFISFKLNWETEQQFDGGSFQYSIDNGNSWITLGRANYSDCLQKNWFNQNPVTYLSPLTSDRNGWSGNIQSSTGSCRGGNGSNGWVTASTVAPELGGQSSVIFRFLFGAGTICNDYNGFAVDDIYIGNAPPNQAAFSYTCIANNTANFKNESILCPTSFQWDFGDPASGANNTSSLADPSHTFSGPGTYTVRLTVSGPGNAPSVVSREIKVISAEVIMLEMVDCETNTGGMLTVSVEGTTGPLNLLWNTAPPQTTTTISNLSEGTYSVTISGTDVCPVTATGKAEKDISCIGIFFPSGFTPNGDGKNDGFGPLGSLSSISEFKFSIYNRWGERIFYSTNPVQKWEGTVKGLKTDGNVFVWQAEYRLRGQPQKQFVQGTVVLIR